MKERPVLERPGITVIGEVIGAESDGLLKEALDGMVAGGVHLCPEDPCPLAFDGTIGIHATRVRSWALQKFAADYLSRSGKAALKKAIRRCQAPFRWPACCGSSQALKGASQGAFQAKAPSRCWRAGVPSDGEELDGEADATGPDSAALRDKLRETRERIIGSTTPLGARRGCDSWVRGSSPARLVAGTSLSPDQSTPLALAPLAGTRDAGEKNLMKMLERRSDAASRLLAQGVRRADKSTSQQAAQGQEGQGKERRSEGPARPFAGQEEKEKEEEERSQVRSRSGWTFLEARSQAGSRRFRQIRLQWFLRLKLKQIKEAPASRLQRRGQRAEHRTSSTSQSSQRTGLGHGHVGQKHAQDQLDKGTLLETEGAYSAGITLGVEISTFFALLIRPFYTQRRMP